MSVSVCPDFHEKQLTRGSARGRREGELDASREVVELGEGVEGTEDEANDLKQSANMRSPLVFVAPRIDCGKSERLLMDKGQRIPRCIP